jgi:hypothetical protein
MDPKTAEEVKSEYEDPTKPGSLGGLAAFLTNRHVSNAKEVSKLVRKLETYSLFTPVRKNFRRRRTISLFRNHIWYADLKILDSLQKERGNYGYANILVIVDGFSKFVMAKPLKTKTG